jgi:ADP-ribose pyrophosphatase YjhB (NUDIX family)
MKEINHLIAVGAMVEKDGKILLVQEKKPRAYRLWNTPAGHLDKGETVMAGARREVKEETGYDVRINGLLGVYLHDGLQNENLTVIKIVFRASIIGGELKFPKDELLDARWFEPSKALAMKDSQLRSSSIRKEIEDYVKNINYPVNIIRNEA